MLRLYEYLFYRTYARNMRLWKGGEFPKLSGLAAVSFMMDFNLMILGGILDIMGVPVYASDIGRWVFVGACAIVFFINDSWLVRSGRYLELVERYKDEPKTRRRRNALLLWLYFIGTLGILLMEAEIAKRLYGSA